MLHEMLTKMLLVSSYAHLVWCSILRGQKYLPFDYTITSCYHVIDFVGILPHKYVVSILVLTKYAVNTRDTQYSATAVSLSIYYCMQGIARKTTTSSVLYSYEEPIPGNATQNGYQVSRTGTIPGMMCVCVVTSTHHHQTPVRGISTATGSSTPSARPGSWVKPRGLLKYYILQGESCEKT